MKTFTKTLTAISFATLIGGIGSLGSVTQGAAANDIKPMLSV